MRSQPKSLKPWPHPRLGNNYTGKMRYQTSGVEPGWCRMVATDRVMRRKFHKARFHSTLFASDPYQ